jgi:ADP-ribosylglycohydrolase
MRFIDRLAGSLYGVAIGDGMGGPVEGWTAAAIADKFSGWDMTQFIPAQEWKPKGHGRITDDTLMTEALIRAYGKKRGHLDAFDFRDFLLPEMTRTVVWLPEWQKDTPIIDRMNFLEKYAVIRLAQVGAEPRVAGIGNGINCAIAMFIMPVGAVNAGDPYAAYQEAAALGLAESHSYAVEGAAALAAAYAAAMGAAPTVADVTGAALRLAREGTRAAIKAVLDATSPSDGLDDWIAKVRAAVLPFDAHSDARVLEADPTARIGSYPDPRKSIEETPVALAALKYGQGDFSRTLKAAIFYGRDCDSIAGMACGLCGAIAGQAGVPQALRDASAQANRRDWAAMAAEFAAAIADIHAADEHRWANRQAAMG